MGLASGVEADLYMRIGDVGCSRYASFLKTYFLAARACSDLATLCADIEMHMRSWDLLDDRS